MNREQIEQWADEVGMCCEFGYTVPLYELEAFARLVAAWQKEQDAKICDVPDEDCFGMGKVFAAAIRKGE